MFGDRQNIIDHAISTGVMVDDMAEDLITSNLTHDIVIKDSTNDDEQANDPTEANDADNDTIIIDDGDNEQIDSNDMDHNPNDTDTNEEDNIEDSDEEPQAESMEAEEGLYQTRSGRTIRPPDMSKRFLESGFHQSHTKIDDPNAIESTAKGVWIKPFYYDEPDIV